jgi:hypothetical protein
MITRKELLDALWKADDVIDPFNSDTAYKNHEVINTLIMRLDSSEEIES